MHCQWQLWGEVVTKPRVSARSASVSKEPRSDPGETWELRGTAVPCSLNTNETNGAMLCKPCLLHQ